jgi:hypothetical protein
MPVRGCQKRAMVRTVTGLDRPNETLAVLKFADKFQNYSTINVKFVLWVTAVEFDVEVAVTLTV